ncbi:hypothetical protein GCM10023093_11870 [Nemorincola caseinilytica]|uniref:Organic solvent tolerance-like N-terminal domain-containing protein n=1 Tax=Nemorincola caseinilytica TaxID=2054315 RepID=A0ABP8N9F9_9BACT
MPTAPGATIRYTMLALLAALLLAGLPARAQKPVADTADKVRIIIANTGFMEHYTTDSGSLTKFVNDVVVYQGTDTLYCDSMYQFVEKKRLEAFGNVRIAQQGGTEGTCSYLRYASDKRIAYMTGDVLLTDGKNRLWCQELTYDLGTKTGTYNRNGTLQSDSTMVTSIYGVYNVRSHDARFTGNVVVLDPQYKIASKDLGYNTETRVERFYDYSVVTSDSGRSVLTTWSGTYDSKNVVARFTGHSSIWNDGQYIEADSMHYDKGSGYGYAIGHVISIDTAQHATIYCGRVDYFRKQRVLWAIIKPVLELANGPDTFYMRADTFYSAPMVRGAGRQFRMPQDTADNRADSTLQKVVRNATILATDTTTIIKTKATDSTAVKPRGRRQRPQAVAKTDTVVAVAEPDAGPIDSMWTIPAYKYRVDRLLRDTARQAAPAIKTARNKKKKTDLPPADTTAADTTSPIFFTGYHHVLIFSDSMQARCDSVCYTRADSIVRMIYDPVAWARGSQITGDTILMLLDSGGIQTMYIPNSGFMTSRSGPEQAQIYDQIQGESITAFFKENAIKKMIVTPDAQSIYYSKDDDGAYVGMNEATSVLMRIYFGEQQISRIKFEKDVHQTMTPMHKADLPNARLKRFKWLYDERPKSKDELFE